MSLTYKAHKNGLLFSNGNYVPKVRTSTGWKYDFGANYESEIKRESAQETVIKPPKSRVDQRNWLTF